MAQQRLRDIAGKQAMDCGHVGLHQAPDVANDCAVKAWKTNRPFFVRYDVAGIDSRLVVGLASSGGGGVSSVKYDSMGWDTHTLRSEAKLLDGDHTLVTPCPSPVRLFAASRGYLSCY